MPDERARAWPVSTSCSSPSPPPRRRVGSTSATSRRRWRPSATRSGEALRRNPGRYRVVIVRSTVPPGTTDDVVIPLLEAEAGPPGGTRLRRLREPRVPPPADAGERLRRASARHHRTARRTFWATSPNGLNVGLRMSRSIGCRSGRPSSRSTRTTSCNASKIAFFNELRRVADAIGVDAERVFGLVARSSEAMWNAEYGTRGSGSVRRTLSTEGPRGVPDLGGAAAVWTSPSCRLSSRATIPRLHDDRMSALILVAWFTRPLCAAMIAAGALRARRTGTRMLISRARAC